MKAPEMWIELVKGARISEMIQILENESQALEKGYDIAAQDENGNTFIHHLIMNGTPPSKDFERLLVLQHQRKQALFSAQREDGQTVLHQAASCFSLPWISYFISKESANMSINTLSKHHYTPLHYLLGRVDPREKEFPVVLRLLDYFLNNPQIDLLIININGDNVFQYVLRRSEVEIAFRIVSCLLTKMECPEQDKGIFLGIIKEFYLSYTDDPEYADPSSSEYSRDASILRLHVARAQELLDRQLQQFDSKHPFFSLFFWIYSETYLAIKNYTLAMHFASLAYSYYLNPNGKKLSIPLLEKLIKNQFNRIIIYYRQQEIDNETAGDHLPNFGRILNDFPKLEIENPHLDIPKFREVVSNYRKNSVNSFDLSDNSEFFRQLTGFLFSVAFKCILPSEEKNQKEKNQKECRYTLFSLGALSRDEMLAYSPIEFGVSLEKDTKSEYLSLFRKVVELMELLVIGLGETPCPDFATKKQKGYRFSEEGYTPKSYPDLINDDQGLLELQKQNPLIWQAFQGIKPLIPSRQEEFSCLVKSLNCQQRIPPDWKPSDWILKWLAIILKQDLPSESAKPYPPKEGFWDLKKDFYDILNGFLIAIKMFFDNKTFSAANFRKQLSIIKVKNSNSLSILDKLVKKASQKQRANYQNLRNLVDFLFTLRSQLHQHYSSDCEQAYYFEYLYKAPLGSKPRVLNEREKLALNQLGELLNWLKGEVVNYYHYRESIVQHNEISFEEEFENNKNSTQYLENMGEKVLDNLLSLLRQQKFSEIDYTKWYSAIPSRWKDQNHVSEPDKQVLEWLKESDPEIEKILQSYDSQSVLDKINQYCDRNVADNSYEKQALFQLNFLRLIDKKLISKSERRKQIVDNITKKQHFEAILLSSENELENYKKAYQGLDPVCRSIFLEYLDQQYAHNPQKYSFLNQTVIPALRRQRSHSLDDKILAEKSFWENLLKKFCADEEERPSELALRSPLLISDRIEGFKLSLRIEEALFSQKQSEQTGQLEWRFKGLSPRHHVQFLTHLKKIDGSVYPLYVKNLPENYPIHKHYFLHHLYCETLKQKFYSAITIQVDAPRVSMPFNLLLTSAVPGQSLREVLSKNSAEVTDIDRKSYTEAVWMSMLVNSLEETPEHYLLRWPKRGKAEVVPLLRVGFPRNQKASSFSPLPNILFCLNLMQESIDLAARTAWLRLDFGQILEKTRFLTEASSKISTSIFHVLDTDWMKIVSVQLFQRFKILKEFITNNPNASLLECLDELEPRLSPIYQQVLVQFPSALERFDALKTSDKYVLPNISWSLHFSQARVIAPEEFLKEDKPLLKKWEQELEKGNFACLESLSSVYQTMLISHFNWSSLPLPKQSELLDLLIKLEIPFKKLALCDCSALSLKRLEVLLKQSQDLTELSFVKQNNFQDDWLQSLLSCAPRLKKLTLEKLSELKELKYVAPAFCALESLVACANPSLQRIEVNFPQLRFIRATNNPHLVFIATLSETLKEANLQDNKNLRIEGLQGRLASPLGLMRLEKLSLGVLEGMAIFENHPLLLLIDSRSPAFTRILSLLEQYKLQIKSLKPSERLKLGFLIQLHAASSDNLKSNSQKLSLLKNKLEQLKRSESFSHSEEIELVEELIQLYQKTPQSDPNYLTIQNLLVEISKGNDEEGPTYVAALAKRAVEQPQELAILLENDLSKSLPDQMKPQRDEEDFLLKSLSVWEKVFDQKTLTEVEIRECLVVLEKAAISYHPKIVEKAAFICQLLIENDPQLINRLENYKKYLDSFSSLSQPLQVREQAALAWEALILLLPNSIGLELGLKVVALLERSSEPEISSTVIRLWSLISLKEPKERKRAEIFFGKLSRHPDPSIRLEAFLAYLENGFSEPEEIYTTLCILLERPEFKNPQTYQQTWGALQAQISHRLEMSFHENWGNSLLKYYNLVFLCSLWAISGRVVQPSQIKLLMQTNYSSFEIEFSEAFFEEVRLLLEQTQNQLKEIAYSHQSPEKLIQGDESEWSVLRESNTPLSVLHFVAFLGGAVSSRSERGKLVPLVHRLIDFNQGPHGLAINLIYAVRGLSRLIKQIIKIEGMQEEGFIRSEIDDRLKVLSGISKQNAFVREALSHAFIDLMPFWPTSGHKEFIDQIQSCSTVSPNNHSSHQRQAEVLIGVLVHLASSNVEGRQLCCQILLGMAQDTNPYTRLAIRKPLQALGAGLQPDQLKDYVDLLQKITQIRYPRFFEQSREAPNKKEAIRKAQAEETDAIEKMSLMAEDMLLLIALPTPSLDYRRALWTILMNLVQNEETRLGKQNLPRLLVRLIAVENNLETIKQYCFLLKILADRYLLMSEKIVQAWSLFYKPAESRLEAEKQILLVMTLQDWLQKDKPRENIFQIVMKIAYEWMASADPILCNRLINLLFIAKQHPNPKIQFKAEEFLLKSQKEITLASYLEALGSKPSEGSAVSLKTPSFIGSSPFAEKSNSVPAMSFETRQLVYCQTYTGEKRQFMVGWAAGTRQNNCFLHSIFQLQTKNRVMERLEPEEERQVHQWADEIRMKWGIPLGTSIEIAQGEENTAAEKIVRALKVNVEIYTQIGPREILHVTSLVGSDEKQIHGTIVNVGAGHYVPLWPMS